MLAAAGLVLRVFSNVQQRHIVAPLNFELVHAEGSFLMAAAAGKATKGKKEKKDPKAKNEEKKEKVPIVLTPQEVFYKMKKAVLRRAKKPTKTTGRVCQILGKVDNRKARSVSFSHVRTKRLQKVNLHWRRLWWEEGKCFVLLRLSTKGLKTVTKYGLHQAAVKFGLDLTKHINGTSERKYAKYLPEKEKKLAMIRGAEMRYRSAVRWAKLNDLEPPPPLLPRKAGAKEEPAEIAMAISHGCKVPQLSKPADQRKALLRALTTELIRHGRIKTTFVRAKAVRKHVDHMITLAKTGTLHTRRQAIAWVYDKDLVKTLFEEVPGRYSTREGGYTRIIPTMPRKGDCAKMCYIELV